MCKRWIVLAGALLLGCGTAQALEITAVAPARGTPGTLVAVSGGTFSAQTQPFLGEQYVAPLRITPNQLEFSVPYLSPGNYSLSLQEGTTVVPRAYDFEVLAPTPLINSLDPRNLDFCGDDAERRVYVSGRNFLPGAVALVDGKGVPSEVSGSSQLIASLPGLKPGIYGLSVSNPDGAQSLPHTLWVNSIPEVSSVEQGEDFVNYYELTIRGRNFQPQSTVLIKEPEESIIGQAYRQLTFTPRQDTSASLNIAPQAERLIFVDCRTLIYHRYPTTYQSKALMIQVINPDGQRSEPYNADLP